MRLKIRRLLASLVDYMIIFCIIWILLMSLIKISYLLNFNIIPFIGIGIIVIFFLLIFWKDLILKNISIGKKIYQLEIVDENGRIITNRKILIKRNMASMNLLMFSLYPFMILKNNKSCGDIKYKTVVRMKEGYNYFPIVSTVFIIGIWNIIWFLILKIF